MKRPKIGDIIEIPTSKGLAYAQYAHKNEMFGNLLRVFNRLYDSRPDDLAQLVSKEHDYWQFVSLSYALNKKIFSVAGNAPVPLEAQAFPTLKGTNGLRCKRASDWTFWNGESEWRTQGELTPEQRKLSFLSIATPSFLVGRIEEQWIPEMDPR